MTKFSKIAAIILVSLTAVAVPVITAASNGCIDLDGSKARTNNALRAKFSQPTEVASTASTVVVEIGEVVVTAKPVKAVKVAKKAVVKAVVKRDTTVVCSKDKNALTNEGVIYCASREFRKETKTESRKLAMNLSTNSFRVGE
jgi:hypothetical protein